MGCKDGQEEVVGAKVLIVAVVLVTIVVFAVVVSILSAAVGEN